MALASLGQAPINALNEQSERARRVSLFYEPARTELLRMHDWSFARRTEPLSEAKLPETENPKPLGVAYQYPAGAMYVTRVFVPGREKIPFEEFYGATGAKKYLVCPAKEAYAQYTQDVKDANLFPPDFANTLAELLASKLAMTLTADVNLAQLAYQKFLLALDAARLANKNETLEFVPLRSRFLEAR